MQPGVPTRNQGRSKLGWWTMLIGLMAIVLSLVLLSSRGGLSSMGGTAPPDRYISLLENGTQVAIELKEGEKIGAFMETGGIDNGTSLVDSFGSTVAKEEGVEVAPLFNKTSLVQYQQISIWIIKDSGVHIVQTNQSNNIWIVDIDQIIEEQSNTRDSAMISSACLGICLIPVGLILLILMRDNKNENTAQRLMQTGDGRWIPVTVSNGTNQSVQVGVPLPTTNDVYAAYNGHSLSDPIPIDPDTAHAVQSIRDPFVPERNDTNIIHGADLSFINSDETNKKETKKDKQKNKKVDEENLEKDWEAWDMG